MKKMTNEKARSLNGGWKVYQCNYCGWQIMVSTCALLHLVGIVRYSYKPTYCPHCYHRGNWRLISKEYSW